MSEFYQTLPAAGPKREALRQKGQFWTPDWVAEAMVGYLLAGDSHTLFDPAVGAGAFFQAASRLTKQTNKKLVLTGTEIDEQIPINSNANVQIRDFVLDPPAGPFDGIVANPPYIRHHRLPAETKRQLKQLGKEMTGKPLDGRAGLHIYFLLRSLQLLAPGGRLAFIMPADSCEGVFAQDLWQWITRRYRLDAVVTFTSEATPFPGVDTNPVLFFITNTPPEDNLFWAACTRPESPQLLTWTLSDFTKAGHDLSVQRRQLSEALRVGLSRPPAPGISFDLTLGEYAAVNRGIATGANEFFFLTRSQAASLNIPDTFLIPAIGRTRDVSGSEITLADLEQLDQNGRPTLLFSPDGRPLDQFPQTVQTYLRYGEATGIAQRTLIATRKPWYKMETRKIPPILFAYLGRRNTRFIRNKANVVPLTGFLCLYPHQPEATFTEKLFRVLQHPQTVANLALVGKSYGSGAIKVEPRALERLPIPPDIVEQAGLPLTNPHYRQTSLWELSAFNKTAGVAHG